METLLDPLVDPLAVARSLSELIVREAATADADGTLTGPVVDAFATSGLFGLLVPRGSAAPKPTP